MFPFYPPPPLPLKKHRFFFGFEKHCGDATLTWIDPAVPLVGGSSVFPTPREGEIGGRFYPQIR